MDSKMAAELLDAAVGELSGWTVDGLAQLKQAIELSPDGIIETIEERIRQLKSMKKRP